MCIYSIYVYIPPAQGIGACQASGDGGLAERLRRLRPRAGRLCMLYINI